MIKKKYLYVFFAFLPAFVSQNVHASSPSYDVYFTMVELWPWTPGTTPPGEEELAYYFKDFYRGQYVGLQELQHVPQGFAIEILPKVEVEGRDSKRTWDSESRVWLLWKFITVVCMTDTVKN